MNGLQGLRIRDLYSVPPGKDIDRRSRRLRRESRSGSGVAVMVRLSACETVTPPARRPKP